MSDEAAAKPTPDPTPEAPAAASLLVGAAAIERGEASDVVLARLAKASPGAAERLQAGQALRDEQTQKLHALLSERFGCDMTAAVGGPLVAADKHFELARVLKDELGYRLYVTCCASHWPAQKTKAGDEPEYFEVATVLRRIGPGSLTAAWRVRVPGDAPVIDSLVPLFAGADWQEREQFDLVGVRFRGHPDLRRLMLPEEWEGHPLRRDYAIDTRCVPWR